jgi:lysozyme
VNVRRISSKEADMHDVLTEMLIRHEGLRQFPYQCTADKTTIGVGRNLTDNGITEEEAMYLLENDIRKIEHEVRAAIPCYLGLDPARKIVLLNMAFNMGVPTLLTFRRTLKYLTAGDYNKAATEMMDSKWAIQVGDRAVELSEIMKKGEV